VGAVVAQPPIGYGLDDTNDRDFLFGRTYNRFIFANLFYDMTRGLTTGLEASFWKTLYQDSRAGQGPRSPANPLRAWRSRDDRLDGEVQLLNGVTSGARYLVRSN